MMMVDVEEDLSIRIEQSEAPSQNLVDFLATTQYGDGLLAWLNAVSAGLGPKCASFSLSFVRSGSIVAVCFGWTLQDFDIVRYLSSALTKSIASIRIGPFKPFRFAVTFVQIPMLELPGVVFSDALRPSERVAIERIAFDFVGSCVVADATIAFSAEQTSALPQGFDSCPFLPNCVLDISTFSDFDEYLARKKWNFRKNYKQRYAKFKEHSGSFRAVRWLSLSDAERARIVELCATTTELHNAEGHSDFIAPTPQLLCALGSLSDGVWFLAEVGEPKEIVGALFCFVSGRYAFGILQGLDYDKSHDAMAYFVLIFELLRFSIRSCMSAHGLTPQAEVEFCAHRSNDVLHKEAAWMRHHSNGVHFSDQDVAVVFTSACDEDDQRHAEHLGEFQGLATDVFLLELGIYKC